MLLLYAKTLRGSDWQDKDKVTELVSLLFQSINIFEILNLRICLGLVGWKKEFWNWSWSWNRYHNIILWISIEELGCKCLDACIVIKFWSRHSVNYMALEILDYIGGLLKLTLLKKMQQSGLGSMQGSSPTKSHLPPKVVFHHRSSSTKGRLPPTTTHWLILYLWEQSGYHISASYLQCMMHDVTP